jgi:hypothetical protein
MIGSMNLELQAKVADTKTVSPLLQGAIDMHYHGYPEITRGVKARLDDVEPWNWRVAWECEGSLSNLKCGLLLGESIFCANRSKALSPLGVSSSIRWWEELAPGWLMLRQDRELKSSGYPLGVPSINCSPIMRDLEFRGQI